MTKAVIEAAVSSDKPKSCWTRCAHFFAYQNVARYQSWQIWVGDSPNFGRGFFDQPKRATAIDSESFRELRSIAATFAYFDSQNSERVARRHC